MTPTILDNTTEAPPSIIFGASDSQNWNMPLSSRTKRKLQNVSCQLISLVELSTESCSNEFNIFEDAIKKLEKGFGGDMSTYVEPYGPNVKSPKVRKCSLPLTRGESANKRQYFSPEDELLIDEVFRDRVKGNP